MGSKQASAVLHGEFLGKKGSDRVHAVGQKLAWGSSFRLFPSLLFPLPLPWPRSLALTDLGGRWSLLSPGHGGDFG